jgi:hypothetical protein
MEARSLMPMKKNLEGTKMMPPPDEPYKKQKKQQ